VGDHVLVTVVVPGGPHADLALPGEVPVAELLDLLRAALPGVPPAAAIWAPPGGAPLPPTSSLTACGVSDGAVLTLAAVPTCEPAPGQPPSPPGRRDRLPASLLSPPDAWSTRWLPPDSRRPPAAGVGASPLSPRGAGVLPEPWPLPVRLLVALRALRGGPSPSDGTGPRWSPGRARRAWRDGSYERRLRAALAAAPSARCVLVAVVGAAPRAGATTVAALLAAVLAAERSGRTVAVDASPGPGCLTELLAPCHDLFADELVGLLDHPLLTRRELAAVLARRGRLGVLAARPPAAAPDEPGWARLLLALGRHATTVVVDCGPGATTPGARAALTAADQVVLVSDRWPPSARGRKGEAPTPAAAGRLEPSGRRPVNGPSGPLADHGRPALLLVNRVAGDPAAGAAAARVPGVSGAVLLPADPAAAATPVAPPPPGAPGAPVDLARLPPLWRRRADELAMLLAGEWPFLAPGPGAPDP
jgi:hypothetical protein